ncbi:MAG: LysE family translocator [Acidimicrobiales bacterium]
MSAGDLVALALAALVTIAIPGPSVTFIMGRTLADGRRAAVLTVIGNTLGKYVQVTVVALGVGVLVERSIAVFTVLKIGGALYLVFLGMGAVQDRRRLESMLTPVPGAPLSRRRHVPQGFASAPPTRRPSSS